jgi:hypothetical protein
MAAKATEDLTTRQKRGATRRSHTRGVSDPFLPPPLPPGRERTSNPPAAASFILAVLGFVAVCSVIGSFIAFIPGVAAIVFGVFGLRKTRELTGGMSRGVSIAGIAIGVFDVLASVAAFLIVAVFVASSDFAVIDREPAEVDDYELSDRTCRVDGGLAVAGGILTNRSGAEHGFVISVRFLDGGAELGSASDELETDLEDGSTWAWEVVYPIDPEAVNTDSLDCRVSQVELGDVVSD